jgi:hypothetical protein
MLFPAFVPKVQFDFCVQSSLATAAGMLLVDKAEVDAGGGSLASLEGAVGGSLAADVDEVVLAEAAAVVAAIGLLLADVLAATIAPVELPADAFDAEPDWPQPASNAVPATLVNSEITCRRCIASVRFLATEARSAFLCFIVKTLRPIG